MHLYDTVAQGYSRDLAHMFSIQHKGERDGTHRGSNIKYELLEAEMFGQSL